jgi:16S rRNA (cytosine967-C5)-methyltransferase
LGVRIVETRLGDAWEVAGHFEKLRFDRILVDAPCSGLGVLRRNPEGKWAKTEDLVPHYAKLQSEVLEAVSPRLKEGGVLVYSTCSIEPEENERVVEAFVRSHPEFQVQDLHADFPASASSLITQQGFLFTLFNQTSMDHFFVTKLIKQSKGGTR